MFFMRGMHNTPEDSKQPSSDDGDNQLDHIIMQRVLTAEGKWEADCYCDVCGEAFTFDIAEGHRLERIVIERWHRDIRPGCYDGTYTDDE